MTICLGIVSACDTSTRSREGREYDPQGPPPACGLLTGRVILLHMPFCSGLRHTVRGRREDVRTDLGITVLATDLGRAPAGALTTEMARPRATAYKYPRQTGKLFRDYSKVAVASVG